MTIDHGDGIVTLYAHMIGPTTIAPGEPVSAGEIVGAVGDTGASYGAHLHFEVHVDGAQVNPRSKLSPS